MRQFIIAYLLTVMLTITIGLSADNPPFSGDHPDIIPARLKWKKHEESQPILERYSKWQEQLKSIAESPDGQKQFLHVYGWGIGRVLKAGAVSIPIFNRPLPWEKCFFVYDGKIFFNQPDGSVTLIDLETGKVIGRSRTYFTLHSRQGKEGEQAVIRIGAKKWQRCGKNLLGEKILVDADSGTILENDALAFIACPDGMADSENKGKYFNFYQEERNNLWQFVDTLKATHGLETYPLAACLLPNNGFAWIECAPGETVPKLLYRDDTSSWSGTIRTADKLLVLEATQGIITYFAIAGDNKSIVYASDSGKMECLDRATGQSRWIYVFPRLFLYNAAWSSIMQSERFTFAAVSEYHQFFTERADFCDGELDTKGVLPFRVDGKEEPGQVLVTADPSPDMSHKEDVFPAAAAAWGLSLTLAAAIALAIKAQWRRLYKSLVYIAILIAANFTLYFFGGYSWYPYMITRIDFWAALILLVYPYLWPRIRAWAIRQSQDD
jgi:outer membrane protein assembly factor BamB